MNETGRKVIERRQTPQDIHIPGMHPVLARIYASRGVRSVEQTKYSLKNLPSPFLLKDMTLVCDRLKTAIEQHQSIVIVGDYDVDGATSTSLAMRALKLMGHANVDYVVPDRFKYGYGLTPAIVDLSRDKSPDLIVTVDNGISSLDGVRHARALGIDVIITDHHLPGDPLPEGTLCINPNQVGDEFPSKNLAGVGVIFYVMLALRTALRDSGFFDATDKKEPNLAELLDLVALGTVADVVPLDQLNRTLVAQGLQRINTGSCCPGIRALLELGKRSIGRVVAADMGFVVGPRLNAAGRLDDMSTGIGCLLADDMGVARQRAATLDSFNKNRRQIEQSMKGEAADLAERALSGTGEDDAVLGLCLYEESWHEGVIGIVAQRIRERTCRPVIAFAQGADGMLKGSARSIPALHVRDLLESISTQYPGLLVKFGGHAMAAGVTIEADKLEDFRCAWDDVLGRFISEQDLTHVVLSDGELDSSALDLEFAELLRASGPWGSRFTEPVFDGVFRVIHRKIVGQRHLKMVLSPGDSNHSIDAICFNFEEKMQQECPQRLRLAYRLDVNEFRENRSPQMIIEYMEPVNGNH